MSDQVSLGFEFARDLAQQLITLSTGILALSITFTKDLVKGVPSRATFVLGTAWLLYVFCILFGLLHLMALTGELAPTEVRAPVTRIGDSSRLFAMCQLISFLLATIAMVA